MGGVCGYVCVCIRVRQKEALGKSEVRAHSDKSEMIRETHMEIVRHLYSCGPYICTRDLKIKNKKWKRVSRHNSSLSLERRLVLLGGATLDSMYVSSSSRTEEGRRVQERGTGKGTGVSVVWR